MTTLAVSNGQGRRAELSRNGGSRRPFNHQHRFPRGYRSVACSPPPATRFCGLHAAKQGSNESGLLEAMEAYLPSRHE